MHALKYLLLPWLAWSTVAASSGEFEPGSVIVGIDLGTTHSCVGVHVNGRVEIIVNEEGDRLTPSWVAFGESEIRVGNAAKRIAHTAPEQAIFAVKRLIGRDYDDPDLTHDMKHWPFRVVNRNGKASVQVTGGGKTEMFNPEEISALVLLKMKEMAEAYLGKNVKYAVLAVPAYFNDAQRQATQRAGTIAGLNIVRIINKPTAAAIAYGLDKSTQKSRIVVYDLGGGTLDVSLLSVENNVFEVLATSGDTRLGGEDFNNRVVDHLAHEYQLKTGYNVMSSPRALLKLRTAVEHAKRILSAQPMTTIEIEAFENGKDYSETLTRSKFNNLNFDLFLRTLDPLSQVLKDAKLEKGDIDEIVLVGGSTRIPKIQSLLSEFFEGKELSRGVNPDEAVAIGAAVQAAVMSGEAEVQGVILIDVNALSVGIEVAGGRFEPIIVRNTRVPVKRTRVYSTYADNQAVVQIKVFEGVHSETKRNNHLGTFNLTGIPLAARGVPQIEVSFSIDNNGIIHVDAQETASGLSSSITIAYEARLSEDDVKRMLYEVDADEREKADQIRALKVLNNLRHVVSNMERQLSNDRALSELDKITIRAVIKYMTRWINAHGGRATIEELEAKHDEALGTSEQYFGALGGDKVTKKAHAKRNEL
ncbi:ATPase with role in protein import into the ER [Ceratobasidium sp. 395]|nr:ATPase with role in protein import into the ER [Ceratobasidium sp. 395]